MRNWSILTLILLSTLVNTPLDSKKGESRRFTEMPVMKVNVYMMGRQEVDETITVKIFENIEYLNEAFEGQIKFMFSELFMDPNHAFLPDIYKSFHAKNDEIVEPIVQPIEQKGAINVFLFDTYSEPGQNAALMGFTPLLTARQETYRTSSPRFDRILMAYDGLYDSKTLVHEMGHFFGLKHPWELTASARHRLGIRTDKDASCNHMSYGPDVQKFTAQQLSDMKSYAMRYRTYLMDRVVRVYAGL